ncbi:HlyD family secretion protein [Roseiconus lacunae]|nr:HlyD family secretion protein [Roseiconus lacunae]
MLFCAQYFHPYTPLAVVVAQIDPIAPQLSRSGRVNEVLVDPNQAVRKGQPLFNVDPLPYENAVAIAEAKLEQAKQNVTLSESTIELRKASLERSEADLQYAKNDRERYEKLVESGGASQDEVEQSRTRLKQAAAALVQANELLGQANVSVGVAKAQLAQSETSLSDARYDLRQTTTVAPADGYVTNLQLHPGMLVGPSSGPVLTFVRDPKEDERGVVVATFPEKNVLRIQPGQYAEVAMDAYPGEVITGKVLNVIKVTGQGQLMAGGILPASVVNGQPSLFAVRILIDDQGSYPLLGGAQGQAAVYTSDIQIAGIPVMFLIRAKSWMNYLF